jgi:heme/copper-type cytochrome/quinol oxidase subunit 3
MNSTTSFSAYSIPHDRIDRTRGTQGMFWFIVTEAMLFLMLFFSYFYLRHFASQWQAAEPPKLGPALSMLAILLGSSGILYWGERAVARGHEATGRLAIVLTIGLGLAFLAMQVSEYRERLLISRPTDDAYGSMFYVITGTHGAHVLLGLLMLSYVLILPRIGANDRPPHHPMKNVALYWHFVDVVWIVIVAILYLLPRMQ